MVKHYIIQVGQSHNFIIMSSKNKWYIQDKWKSFCDNVKEGDILWFSANKDTNDLYHGKIIAVATFVSKNEKDFSSPLKIEDAGCGVRDKGPDCNIEIHYTNLYNLISVKLYTGLERQPRITFCENIKKGFLINYAEEYERIVKYSQITNTM